MFHSNSFGRLFWVDEAGDFKSCPENIDGTGDFSQEDYVSDWTDWDGVNFQTLFSIHQACVINRHVHNNSLNIKLGV